MDYGKLWFHHSLLVAALFFSFTKLAFPQGLGCATLSIFSPCINPVPMTNATGTWITGTDVWVLSMSATGSVAESVEVKPPLPSCPDVIYQVIGTISYPIFLYDSQQGSTSFTWTASNPNPNTPCNGAAPAISGTFSGSLRNNSNEGAEGTIVWTYSGSRDSGGSYFLNRSPNLNPIGETTYGVGFSTGLLATVAQFRVELLSATQINSPDDIFRRRQVREYTSVNGPRYDTCHFSGSTVPKFDSVQGTTWNIGYYGGTLSNYLVDDYIEWNTNHVDYYRQHWPSNSFPRSSRIQQEMHISMPGFGHYTTNDLWTRIYTTFVTVQRGTVTQTVNR